MENKRLRHRLKFGVGFNPGGEFKVKVNGKNTREYRLWDNMMSRCYSEKYHLKYHTYIGVSVAEEWLDFQVFAKDVNEMIGFSSIDEFGKVFNLDKDILTKGNKVYSRETCVFVPQTLNKFFVNNRNNNNKKEKELPIGVSLYKETGKYRSDMAYNGKQKYLGIFTTPELARKVYVDARNQYARELGERYKNKVDPRVIDVLLNYNEEEWTN